MKKTQKQKSKPIRRPAPSTPGPKQREHPLAQLEAAELIRRLDEPDLTYIFKHALTQESAYQSLLNRTRRDIHLHVAGVYEDLYADRLDEYAALLAQHYAEAGDDAKALVYETRAGDASTRLYANAEAIEHYSCALEISKRATHLAGASHLRDIYVKRGRVFEWVGQYDRALANYDEMHALALERGDRAMELSALLAAATVHSVPTSKYNPSLAKELSDRALKIARETGDRGAEAHILWNLMLVARWLQNPADAARYGEQSLAIARECNLREQMAYTLNDLAIHGYLDAGELDKALVATQQARQLWREMNNQPMLADSYSGSAIVSSLLGKFDEAIAASDEALKISEAIGNPWGQSFARWIVGDVYLDRGEPEHAIQVMEDCIRFGEQAGFAGAEVGVRNSLAMACAHCGLIARALDIAQKSLEIAETRFATWAPWSGGVLARLYVREGKIAEAEAAVRRTTTSPVESYIGRAMPMVVLQLALAEVEIALAKNDLDYSPHALDALITFTRKNQARSILHDMLYAKGVLELARHQDDVAQESLMQARDIAESLVARRTLWQIYAALAEIQARRGNGPEARSLRVQARGIVQYIAAHASQDQREAFLNLPSVCELMRELA